jgi:hypothetical protein
LQVNLSAQHLEDVTLVFHTWFWTVDKEVKDLRKEGRRGARRESRRRIQLSSRVDELEERLDRLTLVTQSLWEVAKTAGGLDDGALTRMVRDIDLSDGALDGRSPKTVCVCAAYEQVMSADHETCLYCGEPKLDSAPFEGL